MWCFTDFSFNTMERCGNSHLPPFFAPKVSAVRPGGDPDLLYPTHLLFPPWKTPAAEWKTGDERWAGWLTNPAITDAFQDHTLQMREGEKLNLSACMGSSHPCAPSTDPHTVGKLSRGLCGSSTPTHPTCTHRMNPNRLFFHLGERKLKPCESRFASEGKQIGFA